MLLWFHTMVPIVCVPSFNILMYKEQYILLQIVKEKYALACIYACILFNFNVRFVKCFSYFL
jgi:hypothetical protein